LFQQYKKFIRKQNKIILEQKYSILAQLLIWVVQAVDRARGPAQQQELWASRRAIARPIAGARQSRQSEAGHTAQASCRPDARGLLPSAASQALHFVTEYLFLRLRKFQFNAILVYLISDLYRSIN